jgi:hypothetical protein
MLNTPRDCLSAVFSVPEAAPVALVRARRCYRREANVFWVGRIRRSESRIGEMRNLQLPEDLCAAAENRFGHEFGGLEGLLVFVLNDLLRDEANSADQSEQKLVEERLRELGYL